jgi:hypothetical protein
MEEHMQNMQFHQEPEAVCDQKQHLETPDDQDNFDEIDVNNRIILKGQDMPEAFLLTVNYNILVAIKCLIFMDF